MRVRAALAAVALSAAIAACGGSSATPSPSTPPASAAPPSAAPSVVPVEVTPTPQVTTPPATGTTYVVKKGDTLYGIARHFKITLKALQDANPSIKDPKLLKIGQKLVIPAP